MEEKTLPTNDVEVKKGELMGKSSTKETKKKNEEVAIRATPEKIAQALFAPVRRKREAKLKAEAKKQDA